MNGSERRRHPRINAKDTVGVMRGLGGPLGEPVRIENLSLGGLFARCEQPLRPGSPVIVELSHPSLLNPLKLLGGVVSSRGVVEALSSGSLPGMGIRFDPLPADTTARLESFLEALRVRQARREEDAPQRNAFDFGFVSLESLPETMEPQPVAQKPTQAHTPTSAAQLEAARQPDKTPVPIKRGVLQKPVKMAVTSAGAFPVSAPPPAPAAPMPVDAATAPAAQVASPPAVVVQPTQPTSTPAPATRSSLLAAALAAMLPTPPVEGTTADGKPLAVADEVTRLRVQMLGLIAELDEARTELGRRTRELEDTRAELERARVALVDRDRRLMELAHHPPGLEAH